MERSEDRFSRWDQAYQNNDLPWDTQRPSSELVRVVKEHHITPCRVLEIGCGTGTNSLWLADQGFEVTGVDLSPTAIEIARSKASHRRVRFLPVDMLEDVQLVETFPFFFDRGCYHVVRRTEPQKYLANLDRLTTLDAIGLVLTGNAKEPRQEKGPPVVSEEELRTEIGSLFTIEELREFRFDSPPGTDENFLAWSCFVRKKAPQ
ncbi:MAG: class I SAM-dependent methyltransferase [Gemmataceae bacterium]